MPFVFHGDALFDKKGVTTETVRDKTPLLTFVANEFCSRKNFPVTNSQRCMR